MAFEKYSTAEGSSVGGQGVAHLLAGALLADMNKPISHFHGKTVGELQAGLVQKENMVQAEHIGAGLAGSVGALEHTQGTDGIAMTGAVEQIAENLGRG